MKRIVLVNGPARSGKDTLGAALKAFIEARGGRVEILKFANPLKEMTHRLYDLEPRADLLEDCKDEPNERMFGRKPREAYIAVSEKLMKPLHGNDIFGRLLCDEILVTEEADAADSASFGDPGVDFYVVTDSGFLGEAMVLHEEFGSDRLLLVQLAREGFDFTGDSRSYINLPNVRTLRFDLGRQCRDLNSTIKTLAAYLES